MVIALIQWFIKPDDEAAAEFQYWWESHATVDDPSGLGGEFLSEPVRAEGLPYASDDMRPRSGEYLPFVNVALWRDERAFRDQVARYFNDDAPPEPFEAKRRVRTVLTPVRTRMGGWPIAEGFDG